MTGNEPEVTINYRKWPHLIKNELIIRLFQKQSKLCQSSSPKLLYKLDPFASEASHVCLSHGPKSLFIKILPRAKRATFVKIKLQMAFQIRSFRERSEPRLSKSRSKIVFQISFFRERSEPRLSKIQYQHWKVFRIRQANRANCGWGEQISGETSKLRAKQAMYYQRIIIVKHTEYK